MNQVPKDQPCPHCGRFDNRGVSIDAVIVQDQKILLIKRGVEPFKGYWGTPGGYVLWDESTEQAVGREVKEETGLDVTKTTLVKVDSNPIRHPRQVINFVYLAEVGNGEPVAGDDAAEIQWFDLSAMPAELAYDHAQNIQAALELRPAD